ncbi:MAG: hypothetical protein Q8M07_18160 [Prosthecobacter sp.]|nr:hypothetical protein [Prosthecobacter sp.]
MKPTPPEAQKKLGKDLETFAQLPVKTKELEELQHKAEKATGEEQAALHQMIRDKARQDTARLAE